MAMIERIHVMATVGIRELSRNTSKLINEVHATGKPVVVTRDGRPVAAIYSVDEDALEDFVLANAPEFVASMQQADDDLRLGRTRPAVDVFADIAEPEASTRS